MINQVSITDENVMRSKKFIVQQDQKRKRKLYGDKKI
ncbi:unnamed protein product [Paramecium sonneborni]|uniref:Uncharacterized protein n=1 Tax=Paramecium sonneborni TaxID=65129 RepID=A0A8S1Q797_9CILI|nr:unnamed protein product [Paramecium sonneborni]